LKGVAEDTPIEVLKAQEGVGGRAIAASFRSLSCSELSIKPGRKTPTNGVALALLDRIG